MVEFCWDNTKALIFSTLIPFLSNSCFSCFFPSWRNEYWYKYYGVCVLKVVLSVEFLMDYHLQQILVVLGWIVLGLNVFLKSNYKLYVWFTFGYLIFCLTMFYEFLVKVSDWIKWNIKMIKLISVLNLFLLCVGVEVFGLWLMI